jgi:drug/metabolite transporter (DMT)-like permease
MATESAPAMSSDETDSPWMSVTALTGGILATACAPILVRWAGVPGPASALYRLLFAALVIVPLWLVRRRTWPVQRDVIWAAGAGALLAANFAFLNSALLLTTAATATLIAGSAPLWVGIGSLLIFRQRLPARYWGGLAMALVGMTVVLGGSALWPPKLGLGESLAMATSFCYAAYLLIISRIRTRLDTLSIAALGSLSGVATLLAVALGMGIPLTGYDARTWAALLAVGLVSHVGGLLGIGFALGRIPATTVSVALLGIPVLAALLAVPLLGEPLDLGIIVGGLLILGGIGIATHR